jgi:protein TonB
VQEPVSSAPEINKIQTKTNTVQKITDQPKNSYRETSLQKIEPENTVSGTLQTAYPRYQLNSPPPYPRLARKRGQEGTVILQVRVNESGRVDDLKLEQSSNYNMLDRAALTAVRTWIFEPGRKGEKSLAMWVRVPVTFQLKE